MRRIVVRVNRASKRLGVQVGRRYINTVKTECRDLSAFEKAKINFTKPSSNPIVSRIKSFAMDASGKIQENYELIHTVGGVLIITAFGESYLDRDNQNMTTFQKTCDIALTTPVYVFIGGALGFAFGKVAPLVYGSCAIAAVSVVGSFVLVYPIVKYKDMKDQKMRLEEENLSHTVNK
jgi:hypothetical protein